MTSSVEYALMVDRGDGLPVEYVPAGSFAHAERMAATIYRGISCRAVGRKVKPWRYVYTAGPHLADEVQS